MALLANQLMDARILSSMNGRVELPQFLRVPNQGGIDPQMNPGQEDNRKNRKYPCPLCGKRFRFNSILSLHMRTHTGEKPFKCPYCDHRAAQKGNLKIHLRTHKQGILGKGRGRIREENRLLHELEERAILRDRRQMRGGQGGQLRTPHVMAQLQQLPPSVPAHPPQMSLTSPGSAVSPSHASTPPKLTTAREEPIQHGPLAGFRCSFCKGKFRKQQELERHIRILHKPYKCTLCEFAASQEEELIGHVETAHITADAAVGPKAAAAGGADKKPAGEFPCEVCGQTFSQAWFLKGHMRKHKDSFEHHCQICGRRFKEPWFLKNHMKVHLNKLAKSKPPDERSAPVSRSNVPQQGLQTSLYSQYISSIHSRFLSAERAGQQEYSQLLATAGIEVKIREMLGRMMVSGQGVLAEGDSPSLLALNHLFPTMSSNRLEYLQTAMADRDALNGGGFPSWPVMAPGLAVVEPQLFGPKEIQQPRSYLSERRRSVDERKACLGEADAEVISRATTPGSLTHHEQSEVVSETGGPTHSGVAQDSYPQTTSPPTGDQAYRCTLPSDYASTQPTSRGFHMERYHFTHWQSGRDLSSPLQPPASTSPGPSPNHTLRPGSRENWSPDAALYLAAESHGDDTLHANTQPDLGNQVVNGSLKGQTGKCEYEPLDLSVRPESVVSHADRCPGVLVPAAASLYGNGNSSFATTTPRLRNYSHEPGVKPAQQCDLLARGAGEDCLIQTHKNYAGLPHCDPADQNGMGGFEDVDFDPEEEEDEEEIMSNWMMMKNNNTVEPNPQVPTDFQGSDEALSPPREKLPKWGRDVTESPISSLEKVTPGQGHPLQHHRSLLSVLRSSGGLNEMLLSANSHAATLNADGALDKDATSGGKPFRCRYCSYSASQKGNLKTHVLCVHRRPFDNSLYPDRRLRRSHSSSSSPSSSSSSQKLHQLHQLYSPTPPPMGPDEDTPPTTPPGRERCAAVASPCGT